jgi:hypothetical protein
MHADPNQAEHEVHNGAIGGMDSSYYAFCGVSHPPRHSLATSLMTDTPYRPRHGSDRPRVRRQRPAVSRPADVRLFKLTLRDLAYQTFFDQLLRVLLEFKSQPAVIILGAWSPQVALDLGYADPQIIHTPIAQCADSPSAVCDRLTPDSETSHTSA